MDNSMIVLTAKKVLIGGSRTAQCGVFISFKSPDNIVSKYVSIELNNVNKYFEITEVNASSERGDLANCALYPRPIGRGYKALKNNVFYL